jgi:hypothetical protein
VPVTTVPAASITATTATTPRASSLRSRRTSERAGAVPSVHLACSATRGRHDRYRHHEVQRHHGRVEIGQHHDPAEHDLRHHAGGLHGGQPDQVGPAPGTRPTGPEPPGRDEHRHRDDGDEHGHQPVAEFDPGVEHGSPRVCAAIRLPRVHCGQSGQPSPDLLSRTAAPVTMMPAVEITPASAIRRMDTGLGAQTASAQRRSTAAPPAPRGAGGGALGSAGTPQS